MPEYFKAVDRLIESNCMGGRIELVLFCTPFDRLMQDYTLSDDLGHLYKLRAPYTMFGAMRDPHEKLVTELQKLREENRDLLAENARMRRRLDK